MEIVSLTSSLWGWELLEYASVCAVILGVWGEYLAQFSKIAKCEAAKDALEKRSTLILIMGLVVELVALFQISAINGRIIEELRKENLALEIRLQPRTITRAKEEQFINILARIPKGSVRVACTSLFWETQRFTKRICSVLEHAGFSISATNCYPEILAESDHDYTARIFVGDISKPQPFATNLVVAFQQIGFHSPLVDYRTESQNVSSPVVFFQMAPDQVLVLIGDKAFK